MKTFDRSDQFTPPSLAKKTINDGLKSGAVHYEAGDITGPNNSPGEFIAGKAPAKASFQTLPPKGKAYLRGRLIPSKKQDGPLDYYANNALQAKALKGALDKPYKFAAPKNQQDITAGRNNAQDSSKMPKGTIFK
jgi:hypothetical protein